MTKVKFNSRNRIRREDAFQLTGDLFAIDGDTLDIVRSTPVHRPTESRKGAMDLENDIHPSISDFVVNVKRRQEEARVAESMEMDTSCLSDPDTFTFISFGSGSSGNCAYLGSNGAGILIDAGVDPDTVKEGLRSHGISPRSLLGIIVTHDHSDHVKFAYSLLHKRFDMGLYCTPKTLTGLLRRHSISRRIKDYHRPIYKEFPFKVGPFEITAFDVSHDGTDNVGYFITHGDHTMAIATDLGSITPRVDHYMRLANHIVIESNYDEQMLANGPYPMHLRARIAAPNGHLDNKVTAAFLAEIASEHLRDIFLCHLSNDNNTPQLALNTVRQALECAGVGPIGNGDGSIESSELPLQLSALPRKEPSSLFALRK